MPAASRPKLPVQHWLFKADPDVFSIDHLAARPNQTEPWDGVRNYLVRNWLRDRIKAGDKALFYHSNCPVPGLAGEIDIVTDGYPDHTQFNPKSKYFDPKATLEAPRWFLADVKLVKRYQELIPLSRIREYAADLEDCTLLATGNRLSVFPISRHHWEVLTGLAAA